MEFLIKNKDHFYKINSKNINIFADERLICNGHFLVKSTHFYEKRLKYFFNWSFIRIKNFNVSILPLCISYTNSTKLKTFYLKTVSHRNNSIVLFKFIPFSVNYEFYENR